jgi:soluble lytic murein transglycosylase-like protein
MYIKIKKPFWQGVISLILFVGAIVSSSHYVLANPQIAETPVPGLKPSASIVEASFGAPSIDAKPHISKPDMEAGSAIAPMPEIKPDLGISEARLLLDFGKLPQPRYKPVGKGDLSTHDSFLYQQIFSIQTNGGWSEADDLIEQLDDFRLRGHVLYQRFMHPTAYRSSFDELVGWLDMYADHPGAGKIYRLALARMPADFKGHIERPVKSQKGINPALDVFYDKENKYVSGKRRTSAQRRGIQSLSRAIIKDLGRGGPTRAYKRLMEDPRAKALDVIEYDRLRAKIANSYMLVGKLGKAMELASASARRSGMNVPLAGWVGGMVAWRHGDFNKAASLFEICAVSKYASQWTASAGAYWASRSYSKAGYRNDAEKWMKRAASHPRTFYGLIAIKALGGDYNFDWSMPDFTEDYEARLSKLPAGRRAMALVSSGQYHLAEAELRQIGFSNGSKDDGVKEVLVSYASHAGLPAFSMQLASTFTRPDGNYYDAALYPLAPWKPQGGYKLDLALVHALIRQESKFNPLAESHSGATGLMQLMPSTASYVARGRNYNSRSGKYALKDPNVNLGIGQEYIERLFSQEAVDYDLLSMVVAYNAGPGNLRKWKESLNEIDDPLLFIESIPMSETRAFVERVMANYWIYRMRMGQDTPSLVALARGETARYVKMDGIRNVKAAENSSKPQARRKSYRIAERGYN